MQYMNSKQAIHTFSSTNIKRFFKMKRKYLSTIGLNVVINNRVKLARVSFTINEDSITAKVVNGHTLSTFKRLGCITLTREAFNALLDDPYDDLVFARAAFGLFGLQV